MDEKENAYALWGKLNPYKSLIHHMIDSGVVAETYLHLGNMSLLSAVAAKTNKRADEVIRIMSYFVACHDIGKAHPYFQLNKDVYNEIPPDYIPFINPQNVNPLTHEGFRHEKYSVKVLRRIWENRGFDEDLTDEITCVIADHHQKRGKIEDVPGSCRQFYESLQDIIEAEVNKVFAPSLEDFECYDWSLFCEALNGVLVLADWISSDTLFMPQSEKYSSLMEYSKAATDRAAETVRRIGFSKCTMPYSDKLSAFLKWESNSLRPMQKLSEIIANDYPRFVIIEDTPGSGKTEAAVFLAQSMAEHWKKSGLYFALPTAATANQMWDRLNIIFERHNIPNFRLVHGMAWSLVEDGEFERNTPGSENEIGEEWLRPSRRALLSQFAVGTVDQVMMAVMNLKFRQLRMLGLTDKVLIIDEVHAYDSYMSTILDRLLEWCGALNIPVILLSATLPSKKKQDYINSYTGKQQRFSNTEYPLISYCDGNNIFKEKTCESGKKGRYRIRQLGCLNDLGQMSEKAIELVKDGGNLCLMLNTVRDAQSVYSLLKDRLSSGSDIQILLYHARYKVKDRVLIEKKCLDMYSGVQNRPLKSILVCTQVVEQSLDVDFDIMMTQICPVDLLLQRLGRVWRHQVNRPRNITEPVVYVVTGDISKSPMGMVYDPFTIRKTEEYLKNKEHMDVPGDLRDAVSAVYDAVTDDVDYYEMSFKNEIRNRSAEGVEIGSPDANEYYLLETEPIINEDNADNLNVSTRLGSRSSRVVLCTEEQKERYMLTPTDRDIQNEMMENSVALLIDIPYDACEDKGVLKGMFIATEQNGNYFIGDNYVVKYNEEIGAGMAKR